MNRSPLDALVLRAQEDSHFVANRLVEFRQSRKLDEAGVADFLRCHIDQLPRLALCAAPTSKDHFPSYIQKVASFVGCDAGRLATLVRECDAVRIATRRVAEDAPRFSLAARDKKQDDTPGTDGDGGAAR